QIVANIGDQYSDLAGGNADVAYKLANPFYFLPYPHPSERAGPRGPLALPWIPSSCVAKESEPDPAAALELRDDPMLAFRDALLAAGRQPASVVGGRPGLRSRLPRPAFRAGQPGRRARAGRADLAAAQQPARSEPAAVGGASDRGARGRALRDLHEDAPRAGR